MKILLRAKILFNQTRIQILLLAILTILAYGNILQNGLSYDDRDFLISWPAIQDSKSGLSAFLSLPDLLAGNLPAHHRGVYRPVRSVYYLLSYKLWGFNPFLFHLQSIIVHFVVVITIYFICKIITKKRFLSFMTAALFATHPIHTEAITYTSASFDSLGLLFAFASFYFYLKAESKKAEKGAAFLLSWLLAFLAFFTYEITLMLPFLIIFYDFCFKKINSQNIISRSRVYAPFLIILFIYIFVRVFLVKIGDRSELGLIYLIASNQAKLSILEILSEYIRLLVFPNNLSVFYSIGNGLFLPFIHALIYIDPSQRLLAILSDISFIIPLTIMVLGFLITFLLFRKYSLLFFCIGWFLISILPVMNILPQGAIMAERFLYLPSFGYSFLTALILYTLASRSWLGIKQKHLLVLTIIIFTSTISAYSLRTFERNKDWKDEETIFLKAYAIEPNSYMVNGALGTLKYERGEIKESIKHFEVAVLANPAAYQTRHQLGLAYERNGDLEKALNQYKQVLEFDSKYYYALSGIGNIYQKQGRYDEAVKAYKDAISVDPNQLDSYFGLAGAYMHKQMYSESFDAYQKALKLRPNNALSHNGLGYLYEQTKETQKAIFEYQKAVELEPTNPTFHHNLGVAFEKAGNYPKALAEFRESLRLQPNEQLEARISELESNY